MENGISKLVIRHQIWLEERQAELAELYAHTAPTHVDGYDDDEDNLIYEPDHGFKDLTQIYPRIGLYGSY